MEGVKHASDGRNGLDLLIEASEYLDILCEANVVYVLSARVTCVAYFAVDHSCKPDLSAGIATQPTRKWSISAVELTSWSSRMPV